MTQPPEPVPGAPTEPATPPPADPPPSTAPGLDPNAPVDVDSLPPNVKQMIAKLRSEAASARTTAKERAAAEARDGLLKQISQAIGLEEAPTDPAVLASQLELTQSDAAAAVLELDVYRAAIDSGVNPVRLLDSVAFRQAIDALDDEGFDDGLKALIAARLEADPSLALAGTAQAVSASRQPVASLRPGTLPGTPEPTIDDQIADAQKSGDWRLQMRLQNQKLAAVAAKKK